MDEPPHRSERLAHAAEPAVLPRTTRAAEGLDRRRFTATDIGTMVEAGIMLEDERVELIGGELVPMSPKGVRHEVLKTRLSRKWYRAATDAIELTFETTFHLSEDTYLEPDVVVYDAALDLGDLDGRNVLLVVEIADSSLRYDIGRKASLYASFGVRELWVIDALRGTSRIFLSPSDNGYTGMQEIAVDQIATPQFVPVEFALRLADLGIF